MRIFGKIFISFIVLFFAIVPSILSANHLKVFDYKDRDPLQMVTVYSASMEKHTSTDERGKADLSGFEESDSIIIRMIGYERAVYSFNDLKAKGFEIFLVPEDISLDDFVVSALRWETDREDNPSRITSISREKVEMRNPQTSADLLQSSGDVFVQKSQLGGGSPMIRGFATNRVLLTVDGVRMNNAIFRGGNIQNVISIDPQSVERTEVLFGPGAVMYGSDAIGGAMNFHTITPEFGSRNENNISAGAMTRYSSANNEKTGNINFNLGFQDLAFVTSITYSQFDDLRMGSRGPDEYLRETYQDRIDGRDTALTNDDPQLQRSSGYDQFNIMQKIRYAPNNNWDIQYGFHYSTTTDIPRYDRLIEQRNGTFRDAEWYYGPQKWMMNVLNAVHYGNNLLYDNMRITLGQQFFQESRHNRGFNNDFKNHRTETVDAFSLNLDFEKELTHTQTFMYGAEAVRNQIGSDAERENIISGETMPLNTRYPDGADWNSLGAYANYMNKYNDNLTLQGGIRYSHIIAQAQFDTEMFPLPFDDARVSTGALNGSAGAAYRPTKNWQLNLNLSTGFRAPNIDDIGKVFDSEPGAVVVPNPDLRSEYAYNAEMGVSRTIGDFMTIDVTGFYTILEDALVRREYKLDGQDSIFYEGEMSRVLAVQNAASANVYGVQSKLDVSLPYNLGFESSFTRQIGEEELEEGGTAPMRHSVPWFGSSRLTYNHNKLRAEFSVDYQSEVSADQMSASERSKQHMYLTDENGDLYSPSWYTLNLKAMYKISDFLSVNAGVENITDNRYRPYSSGITAPGRNFMLSLRARY